MGRKIQAAALLIFGIIGFIDLIHALSEGEPCRTPRGEGGKCTNLKLCGELLNILTRNPRNPADIDFLRQSQCGFDKTEPLVCCPIRNTNNNANNPNNNPVHGNHDTPTQTETNAGQGLLEINRPNIDRNRPSQDTSHLPYVSNLLPTDCGRDLSNRIVGGNVTELDEFPWMALLEYRKPNGKTTACGAALISRRYVLTAAHCLVGKALPKTWKLESVRLGEYNTLTDRDCVADGDDSMRCADDPISVGIEEQIVHESYDSNAADQHSDIALLRLNRDVEFTSFISPICLPRDDQVSQKLQVAGWGKTATKSESDVKLKVSLPLVETKKCFDTYGKFGVKLGVGQICAGGVRGEDSCRGDSGGPLMQVDRQPDGLQRWSEVGVVSFGPSPCGMPGWPGVYTKVYDYTPWIFGKLRP
ncbi:hypothetical protein QAD02_005224 [Eretmocerus hayati]|uniref:Uncharacterized protein n=1 Tax=Eretmocerus hayati TaxID=131215 RepID=A0ACC2NUQ6_9HYME|nr:hypothetical protein QAD02_005224 [Eretmocerus hayati]